MNKYKIGDNVWFMENNKVVQKPVQAIYLVKEQIFYCFDKLNRSDTLECDGDIEQGSVFRTKDALLASL